MHYLGQFNKQTNQTRGPQQTREETRTIVRTELVVHL